MENNNIRLYDYTCKVGVYLFLYKKIQVKVHTIEKHFEYVHNSTSSTSSDMVTGDNTSTICDNIILNFPDIV